MDKDLRMLEVVEEKATPTVLAIDDSVFIHRLLKARLKGEGIEIQCATDPREGLEMARTLLPDVVLLDLDINGVSGFEVLQALKNDTTTNQIPVIFLSGSEKTEDKVRGLELGAVDFITKPFDVPELRARLRSALRVVFLVRMLAQRASLDGLTGLGNRAFFDNRLKAELSEAARYERPLSLIMCDIDKFKSLNDSFGHPFGDRVIEAFARLLSHGRASDIACRYGGEEFAVILPTTTAEEARLVAERFRAGLEKLTWNDHEGLTVTASFGIADLDSAGNAAQSDALIKTADQALYAAKHGGRNRVEVAPRPALAMSA
jgi:two-component system, cell cycle response regulator